MRWWHGCARRGRILGGGVSGPRSGSTASWRALNTHLDLPPPHTHTVGWCHPYLKSLCLLGRSIFSEFLCVRKAELQCTRGAEMAAWGGGATVMGTGLPCDMSMSMSQGTNLATWTFYILIKYAQVLMGRYPSRIIQYLNRIFDSLIWKWKFRVPGKHQGKREIL